MQHRLRSVSAKVASGTLNYLTYLFIILAWTRGPLYTFYRDITVKTKDWKYEQEYRLILEDGLSEFKEKKSRTLRYDFKSLKGIIFGIKTSDEHRLKIIDIIEKKEDYEQADFKFYQAYYSPEIGDIRKFELQIDNMR